MTAALPACAELAGVVHGYAPFRASPPPSNSDRIGGPRSRPKPERRRSGHYRNDQPRGLGMVTSGQPAGGQWRSQPYTGQLRRNGRPPAGYREFRPAAREQARYRPLDPACLERPQNSGREGNIRRNHLEAAHRPWPPAAGPGAAGCISAPRARKRRSVSSGRAVHSPKRTSRHAAPPL